MRKLDNLLSKLDKVKKTAKDNYIACCPAHVDKSPSMTIREIEPDHILMHCFAGCPVENILSSIGMDFDDVYPDRAKEEGRKKAEIPFNSRDVLAALKGDALFVFTAMCDLRKGNELTKEQIDKLYLASVRIYGATEMGGV